LRLALGKAILTTAVAIAIFAAGAAKAERGIMDYKIFFGGFAVAALEIDIERTAAEYRIFSRMQTLGLINQLFPWTMKGYSRGRFVGGDVRPEAAGHTGNWRGNQRYLDVRYDRGRPTVTRKAPSIEKHERVLVTEAEIQNTLDLSSAIISMSIASHTAQGCTGHAPVFDGRRRYDMVAERIGVEAKRYYGRPGHEPRAVKCRVTVVRRSGHRTVSQDSDTAKIKRTGPDGPSLTSALPLTVMVPRTPPKRGKNQSETTDLATMSALWHGPAH